ncbi:MAG: amidohydrolase family protein [Opitutales bacterium]
MSGRASDSVGVIVDVHTHLYPEAAGRNPVAWGRERAEHQWLACVAPEGRPSLQGWASVDRLLADMDAAGVDRAVILGWYWENDATAREQNRFLAAAVRRHPDRLAAWASCDPGAGETALETLHIAIDQEGLTGVGECLPQVRGLTLADPRWQAVMAFARERGLPLNLHVTEVGGPVYPGRIPTPLEAFLELAEAWPTVPLILAHWGGLLCFSRLNRRLRKRMDNVWFDTAASPLLYDDRIYPAAVRAAGVGRILYGSDYPLRVYPKKQDGPDMTLALAAARDSGLAEAEVGAVLGGNAARLFGWA